MKKAVIVIIIIFALLLTLIVVAPLIFKNQINDIVKTEANKYLDAELEFSGIRLSFLRNFPNLQVRIKNISITGGDQFNHDTLIYVPVFSLTVDVKSLISGKAYVVKKVFVSQPKLSLLIKESGEENWNIIRSGEGSSVPGEINTERGKEKASSSYKVDLQRFEIKDANITYKDDQENMLVTMQGMDNLIKGDFSEDSSNLSLRTLINSVTFYYDEVAYLNKAHVSLEGEIVADFMNQKYRFHENKLVINEIGFDFDGVVEYKQDQIDFNLDFKSLERNLKSVLSLIPAVYTTDYDQLKAEGVFSVTGKVEGSYTDEKFPSFKLNGKVENGMIAYEGLPYVLTDFNMKVLIVTDNGIADKTVIDIPYLHVEMDNHFADMSMNLKTPVSDPDLKVALKIDIDLGDLDRLFPMSENESLSGKVSADFNLEGKLSTLEKADYDNFRANGFVELSDISYFNQEIGKQITIESAKLELSPQYIDLQDFKTKIGGNDLSARGRLENYLAYVLQGKTIKGTFTTSSQYIDLDDLMMDHAQEEATEGESASQDSGEFMFFDVPENIDFLLKAHFDQLMYKDMEMKNVQGEIVIKNREVNFHGLEMELLGGSMTLNGKYTTLVPREPALIIDMVISMFDIQSSYNTFSLMQSYLPIANMTTGDFSSQLLLSSQLDRSMMPVYSTLSGSGDFLTSKIVIEDIQVFNELANILKIEKLKNATIDKIDVSFEFVDGKVIVKPFEFNLTDIKGNLQGYTSLDQSIEYLMKLEIPADEFGSSIDDVLGSLMKDANVMGHDITVGKTIMLDVIIDGTLANPKIKVGLKDFMQNTMDAMKKKAEEELLKAKEELERKARKEAEKYMAEVEKRVLKIMTEAEFRSEKIKSAAFESGELIRQEADSTGAKLINEGRKNGMLAELAAKKTAQELVKEADKKTAQIIKSADNQTVTIMSQAKKEADAIKSEALKKYNK